MWKLLNWGREEVRQILPVWIFFFVAFALVGLTRTETLGEYHIKSSEPPEYLVGSLIMAKVVLIVDAFFKNRRLPGRPLIYGTLWTTTLYFVAAMALHYVEQIVSLMRRQHLGVAAANRQALVAMEKPLFWTIMASVLALTFLFCVLRELILAIGTDRFVEMFFGRRPRGPQRIEEDDIRGAA
jgi:hypothetical protein